MAELVEAHIAAGGRRLSVTGPEAIAIETAPRPPAREGHVVVDVTAVGICGTDLHAYRGRSGSFPLVPGHDLSGRIHEVGPGVTGLHPGQRVTIDPTISCGSCAACRRGAAALCERGGYLGMTVDGVMAESVLVPQRQIVPIPDEVDDLQATVLEPIVVALRTLERSQPLLPRPSACIVVGGGPIGLLMAAFLSSQSMRTVLVEPIPARRAHAVALGLEAVAPDALRAVDIGSGPRLVAETSASGPGFELALSSMTPGSVLAVVGRSDGAVPAARILLDDLSVVAVRGGPGLYPKALQLVADGTLDPSVIITHEFDLDDGPSAFERCVRDPAEVLRAVLWIRRDGSGTEG